MTLRLTYTIASVPDRDYLVAELWYDDIMWGEIAQEGGRVTLEIYADPSGQPWSFDLAEVEELLAKARKDLAGE